MEGSVPQSYSRGPFVTHRVWGQRAGEDPQLLIRTMAHFHREVQILELSLGRPRNKSVHLVSPELERDKSLRPTKSRCGLQLKDESHSVSSKWGP